MVIGMQSTLILWLDSDRDDGNEVPLPDYKDVDIAIAHMENNKATEADGLLSELFKYAVVELT